MIGRHMSFHILNETRPPWPTSINETCPSPWEISESLTSKYLILLEAQQFYRFLIILFLYTTVINGFIQTFLLSHLYEILFKKSQQGLGNFSTDYYLAMNSKSVFETHLSAVISSEQNKKIVNR